MKKRGVTRREFIKATGLAAAGTAIAGAGVGLTGRSAWAKKKNNVIIGMTQEPVQFNPLLYVNSGTEEVPEACMFDALCITLLAFTKQLVTHRTYSICIAVFN